jgi:glycosyltransferase involved in cell wall biosynthesis
VETHCEQLFPLLKRRRPNDSITIIARKQHVPHPISEYEGLRIVALGHAKAKHLETITSTVYGVLYARAALKADLVHVHGIGPALTAPLARALGLKVVVTYHSKNYEHRKWNKLARASLRMGELCTMHFADRIIAVSPSLAEDLKLRFPRFAGKVRFIPNGADHLIQSAPQRDAHDVLARYGLLGKQFILSAGRLVPEKGFHDLLDAFALADPGYTLVIAGGTTQRDAYSEGLLQRAGEKVVFTGFISGRELQVLLQNASLFVLPSHNEGLPIAALEAAVAGAPLLLSDIGANRDLELRPDNYFRVGNVEELGRRLRGDYGGLRIDPGRLIQRYNWNAVCAETDEVYSSLLKAAAPGRWRKAWARAKQLIGALHHPT